METQHDHQKWLGIHTEISPLYSLKNTKITNLVVSFDLIFTVTHHLLFQFYMKHLLSPDFMLNRQKKGQENESIFPKYNNI